VGVCGVRDDTRAFALAAAALRPSGRALDLGTGTGYIGLYLALRGWDVDAVDVSRRALALARRNAEQNHAPMRVFVSNLFSQITDCYDVITFNPPLRPAENEMTRIFSSLVRRSPLISRWLMQAFGGKFEPDRHAFLARVLTDARSHLNPGGSLLIGISEEETARLAELPGVRLVSSTPIPNMPRQWVSHFQFEACA
jgi:methylase of polypeptide subunit release factors